MTRLLDAAASGDRLAGRPEGGLLAGAALVPYCRDHFRRRR